MITGANSGIGLASAKRFAAEGARVFMTGRRNDQKIGALIHGSLNHLIEDRLVVFLKRDPVELAAAIGNENCQPNRGIARRRIERAPISFGANTGKELAEGPP